MCIRDRPAPAGRPVAGPPRRERHHLRRPPVALRAALGRVHLDPRRAAAGLSGARGGGRDPRRAAGMSAATDAAPSAPGFELASVTPAAWAEAVARDLPALLSDHAHLELKAAASAMALLRRHGRQLELASRVVPLIREEFEHLQRV